MFNNANVIFRTKFVDGVSTVTKTVVSGAKTKNRSENSYPTNNHETPAKKKSATKCKTIEKEFFS